MGECYKLQNENSAIWQGLIFLAYINRYGTANLTKSVSKYKPFHSITNLNTKICDSYFIFTSGTHQNKKQYVIPINKIVTCLKLMVRTYLRKYIADISRKSLLYENNNVFSYNVSKFRLSVLILPNIMV